MKKIKLSIFVSVVISFVVISLSCVNDGPPTGSCNIFCRDGGGFSNRVYANMTEQECKDKRPEGAGSCTLSFCPNAGDCYQIYP